MGYMFYKAKSFSHYPESWVIPEGDDDMYFGCADRLVLGGYRMFEGTMVEGDAFDEPLKTHPVKLKKGESLGCSSD